MPLNRQLQRIFIDAPSGRRTFVFFVLTAIVWLIFGQSLIPAFQAATNGLYPIDMSFPTTPRVMYAELAQYSAESIRIYRWFFVADIFYPPLAALMWASLWGWLLTFPVAEGSSAMARKWLWLPFGVCILDWIENLGFITVIESYPQNLPVIAWLTSIVKHTKLVVWVGQVAVTVTLLWRVAVARLRQRS